FAATLTALRSVPPAWPPKLTPTLGLMNPSACARVGAASRPVLNRTANPRAGLIVLFSWLNERLARLARKNDRHVDAERCREVDLVFLFVDEDSPDLFGHRELAERLALADALAVVADGFGLVVEIEPKHVFCLVGQLHGL